MEGLTMKTQQQLIYNQEDYELDNQYNDDNRYQRENSSIWYTWNQEKKKMPCQQGLARFFYFFLPIIFLLFLFSLPLPSKMGENTYARQKKEKFLLFCAL